MKTVRLVFDVPEATLDALDNLAKLRSLSTPRQRMSLVEWNRTPNGRAFAARLITDHALRALDIKRINELQRLEYEKDVGPVRSGRPKLHDNRLAVIRDALEVYKNTLA